MTITAARYKAKKKPGAGFEYEDSGIGIRVYLWREPSEPLGLSYGQMLLITAWKGDRSFSELKDMSLSRPIE